MKTDIRAAAARFYDCFPHFPQDVLFYQALIPFPTASVLELGCGTGRVTLPLAPHCQLIHGIDLSPAMVQLCQSKAAKAGLPADKIVVSEGDIADFDLGQRFDLIIAPYRVLQNLETDAEVDGLLGCVRRHLAPGGTCVLNVFKPLMAPAGLYGWVRTEEQLEWEVSFEGGKLACYGRRLAVDEQHGVLYPDLIYRRYEGSALMEEIVLHLVMRCYWPETFEELIAGHGFQTVNRWGGYEGEAYGEGPELVLQFRSGG